MASQQSMVLIVGAGPSGLTMAIELYRHGIPFRIIDKQAKPVPTSNALAVQTRTLEIWDDIGFLPKALILGNPMTQLSLHANGKLLGQLRCELLESVYPFILGLSQHESETIMLDYLAQQCITVEMDWEVMAIEPQERANKVTLRHVTGEVQQLNVDWLVACDGSHSFVRTQLNIPFLGRELKQHFVLADISLQSSWQYDQVMTFLSAEGPLFILQYKQNFLRIIAEVTHDKELAQAKSMTQMQLKQLLERRCSIPLAIAEVLWTSGFWVHERQIENYQHQQIFFVGDAAHVHSPAGGQGMNTGIQDAYNLAWKLALIIKKQAKATLLISYHQERYPIARAVLKRTTIMTRMVSLHNRGLQLLRNHILYYLLRSDKLVKKFVNTIAQLTICYPPSEWVVDYHPQHTGPKPGMRFRDLDLSRQRLFDYLGGTQHVLMVIANQPSSDIVHKLNRIAEQYLKTLKVIWISRYDHIEGWTGELVNDNTNVVFNYYAINENMVYLVRPDKYIGARAKLVELSQLEAYLEHLFIMN